MQKSHYRPPKRRVHHPSCRQDVSPTILTYVVNFLEYNSFIPDSLKGNIGSILDDNGKLKLLALLRRKARIRKIHIQTDIAMYEDGINNIDETIADLMNYEQLRRVIPADYLKLVKERLDDVGNDSLYKELGARIDTIQSIFTLSKAEKEVLKLLYLLNVNKIADLIYESACESSGLKNEYQVARKPISILTGIRESDIVKAIDENSTLFTNGLFDRDRSLPDEVTAFLDGISTTPISDAYFTEFTGETLPLKAFTVDAQHLELIHRLHENRPAGTPLNLLFYGVPGTGKTSLARALGKELGLSVFEIRNMRKEGKKSERDDLELYRLRAFNACRRTTNSTKSVIIFDEADQVLNAFTLEHDKGRINALIDTSNAFVIWITNDTECIHESTMRRFDYSIGFRKLTLKHRMQVWENAMTKHGIAGALTADQVRHLASSYETSAGGIDTALRNAARLLSGTGKSRDILPPVERLIKAHLTAMDNGWQGKMKIKDTLAPSYGLEGLNIHGGLERVLGNIDMFDASWPGAENNSDIRNLNMLLYGPPGSGKTEFARYISRRLNRPLVFKRASDLLSPYVGETEKLIRLAFVEAEEEKAVLFIDEADSFLGSRESATTSWEVSHVNELLTNMESFYGMLICATNFRKVMDVASLRRFNIKIVFDFLNPDGALIFYHRFLDRLLPLPLGDQNLQRLQGITGLTPGDFKVVYQTHVYLPQEKRTHEGFIAALKSEVVMRGGMREVPLGFAKN